MTYVKSFGIKNLRPIVVSHNVAGNRETAFLGAGGRWFEPSRPDHFTRVYTGHMVFEHVCTLLLRLYPAAFRRAYGPEAAQLVRDRARDQRGVYLRLRMLMDLTIDLCAISLRGWQPSTPVPAEIDGVPRFEIIGVHRLRAHALAVGLCTSTVMFAAFALLLRPTASGHPSTRLSGTSGSAAPSSHAKNSSDQAIATDPEAVHTLIAAIAADLEQLYVDRALGRRLADALLAYDKRGEYAALDMGANLAARINDDIQATSRALGIPRGVFIADVVYSARLLPTGPPPPMTEAVRERNRAAMLQQHCLFETIEILPDNVGHLKLNGFADATACRETTSRAMASLNNAGALIIDLRDNGGGFGETALQIASYLFERPAFMYDPRPASPVPARTAFPITGNRLADKPVYILTSSRTQSAAEYFVYNLKMLKRATIVGETTAGHQHSGAFHRISDHFGIGIQEAAPTDNPYPVKGWEIIGVEPDVRVPRTEAFDVARKLAARAR